MTHYKKPVTKKSNKPGRPPKPTRLAPVSFRLTGETIGAIRVMAEKNNWSLTQAVAKSVAFAASRKDFA